MKPKSKQDIDPFEEILEQVKDAKGIKNDTDLDVNDLKNLVVKFKEAVKRPPGKASLNLHGNNFGVQFMPFSTVG